MTAGDVVPIPPAELRHLRSGARPGNSGMGHTCRCYRRPVEVAVGLPTFGGVRRVLMCRACAARVAGRVLGRG